MIISSVEALASATRLLVERGALDAAAVCKKGDVFVAISLSARPGLSKLLSAYLDLVRASPPDELGRSVAVPGDGARRRRERALSEGFEIDPRLWSELLQLSKSPSDFERVAP